MPQIHLLFIISALIMSAEAPEKVHLLDEVYITPFTTTEEALQSYKEFSNDIAPITPDEQHILAHSFGSLLFDELGLSGIVVCDDQFLYGCIHQFTADAILNYGIGVLKELDEDCVSRGRSASFCQHGIGHGIMANLGYSFEDLQEGLKLCEQTSRNPRFAGCFGGLLMEYNLRSMTGSLENVRPTTDLSEPCSKLESGYQLGCWYWMPQWWKNGPLVEVIDIHESVATIGSYCTELPNEAAMQVMCFHGTGMIIATESKFDPHQAISLCETAAANNLNHRAACITEVALRVMTSGDSSNAKILCDALQYQYADRCSATINLLGQDSSLQ